MIKALKEAVLKTHFGQVLLEKKIGYAITGRRDRRLTSKQYGQLINQFGDDSPALARHCAAAFLTRVAIDQDLIRIIKKFKADFGLHKFVETGTFDGETSLIMSMLFERVLTCDVKDWERRLEFYAADNLLFEIKSSPDFLRDHLAEIKLQSLFFLDAHWGPYCPLNEELDIIFAACENPVIIIDDFDTRNGLVYYSFHSKDKSQTLNLDYIAAHVPPDYKFFFNPQSKRNCGMVFIFPPSAPYGCPFSNRANYSEAKHGLWGSLPA